MPLRKQLSSSVTTAKALHGRLKWCAMSVYRVVCPGVMSCTNLPWPGTCAHADYQQSLHLSHALQSARAETPNAPCGLGACTGHKQEDEKC